MKRENSIKGSSNYKKINMPRTKITRDFKKTVLARAVRDKKFRHGVLLEATESLRSGDVKTAKALIKDYPVKKHLKEELKKPYFKELHEISQKKLKLVKQTLAKQIKKV